MHVVPLFLTKHTLPSCVLASSQTECHEFLIKILIVQLQRLPFQPIGLEAQRDKEMAGLLVGEHNAQVDAFEIRQGLRMGNCSLQQGFSYALSAHLLRDVHPPNDGLVMFFGLFLSLEASNANQSCPLKCSKGYIVKSSVSLAKPLGNTSDAAFQ